MKLVHWAFAVCLFTASCDTILNFQVGGSLRLCQIIMIFVCLAAMARIIQDGRILWPRAASALFLWVLGQAICLPFSGVLSFGLEFFLLLLFNCLCILAVLQLYGQSDLIEPLMKIYMASFVVLGVYGLAEFFGPLLFKIPLPGTTQWLVHGRVARISGFSYEPSYYVTYLFIGWIMLVDLRISKARIAQGRLWKWAAGALAASLVLSCSKTAWVFVIVEGLARLAPKLWRSFRLSLHDLRSGRLMVRIPGRRGVSYALLFVVLVAGAVFSISRLPDPLILLGGSGLDGTPAHSYLGRTQGADTTFSAFEDDPLIGRTLGGVAIYIASRSGVQITNIDEYRLYQGFPVILEVLVASGAIGFIPFLVFLYATTFGAMRFAKRYWPQERAKWLRALGRAMVFEWLLLMGDQDLLRVYLWFHFTMVILVAYHLEYAPAPQPALSRLESPSFAIAEASAVP